MSVTARCLDLGGEVSFREIRDIFFGQYSKGSEFTGAYDRRYEGDCMEMLRFCPRSQGRQDLKIALGVIVKSLPDHGDQLSVV